MTKYEHMFMDVDDLTQPLPSGAGTAGALGWRVVGVVTTNAFTHRIILEREVKDA